MENLCLLHNTPYDDQCSVCTKEGLRSIAADIPTEMVQIGSYFVGKRKIIKGEYYKNDLWVETHEGEGCFIPLPKVEKVIGDEFLKHF